MKITHNKIGRNLNLVDTNKTDIKSSKESKGTSGTQGIQRSRDLNKSNESANGLGDIVNSARVDVSQKALDAKRIKELAMSAPDVDEEKVLKFQKLIDDGKYQVDSKAVADRMVDEHLTTAD